MTTPHQHGAIADGEALSLDGIFWHRPWFPSRVERAGIMREVLPGWAIPTAHTAGWIWTGMATPFPLAVLRPSSPALSPLERQSWGAREFRDNHHTLSYIAGCPVLDEASTVVEILTRTHHIDRAATQILFLHNGLNSAALLPRPRMSPRQRERAHRILQRVHELADAYPDITR